uniref:Beta-1,3-glucanase n=1 Tax=Sinopodophyllum hexandrum TaxID=93608 RepID=W8CK56_SINHE|nr:beta-1,3-glucanase [Sinopodophyllum hexandrum]
MRIYDPDQATLEALRDSNIELMLGVPNSDLQSLANDANAANTWVTNNVQNFANVNFRYIAVGNEVSPTNGDADKVSFVLPAMRNIQAALASAGLQDQIKVSTATYNGLANPSYPPSHGSFDTGVQSFLDPIIGYLVSIGSPLLVNVYPYFSFVDMQPDKLSYATFTKTDVEFTDNGLSYSNLFDAIVDATYAALEKAGAPNLGIVISESGWPSAGATYATIDNAKTYNQNLINHVKNGTPKKPGALETYIFAMFNENLKSPEMRRILGCSSPTNSQLMTLISLKRSNNQANMYYTYETVLVYDSRTNKDN